MGGPDFTAPLLLEGIINMIEHEYTALDFVKGGLFFLWFLGSIIALFVVLIKFGPWLTISVFGQIFFVIGLMVLYSGIRNHNFSPPFLIFVYLGLAAIISGLVLQFGSESLKEAPGEFLAYIGLSIFFFFGVSLITSFYVRTAREKNCTELVRAYCVDIKKRRRNDEHHYKQHYLYCPVFSFSYKNKLYEVCSNLYTAYINAELGKEYDLYINPDYPHCFKEEGESGRQAGVEIVLGIFFMCISILAFCLMFFRG